MRTLIAGLELTNREATTPIWHSLDPSPTFRGSAAWNFA